MSKPNTKAQRTQIIEVLKQDYFPIIPQLQRNWTAKQHEENRLSRSLAAFAIANLANITPPQAAHSIINGGDDNGIDAVYFDRVNNRLWLIQAKVGNAPNMGDNKKFCDGIRDLVYKRFQKFNSSFSRLQHDVEDALDRNGLKIVGCNIYLDGSLGTHVVNDLNQLKEELNKFDARFQWQDLNIENIYRWLTAKQENARRYVRIFQYLNQIFEDSHKAETDTRRKNFYQHGRLFILNILSRRYKPLINKPEVNLSQDDMTEFSRVGIELAELIYTLAESQFASDEKGYLAIFRSLTDVQQLTSRVMQELANRDA